jgi:hypothetical protein
MKMRRSLLCLSLLACLGVAYRVAAEPGARHSKDWHVAPGGTATATGAASDPLDLAAALDGRRVQPGDTVWLRGGQYRGTFRSSLSGTAAEPIVVRQWPGERAVLVGNTPRGDGAVLNVFGAWTVYRDFEITIASTDRSYNARFRPMGIEVQAPHTKLVNLVVHDTGIAIGLWENAPDSEIYGNIIYNSGTENTSADKRHGHALYSQNKQGTQTFRDNIMFNQFGWGIHVYSNVGPLSGFLIEGNAVFNSGVQNPSGIRYNNLLVLGHGRPYSAQRVTVQNNYTYQSPDQKPGTSFSDANVSFGCQDPGDNRGLVVRDNVFAGGSPAALFCNWLDATVTGNTFVSPYGLIGVLANPAAIKEYRWDTNRYFGDGSEPGRPQFGVNDRIFSSWDAWVKGSRLDAHSQYESGRPHGAQVFVRPNAFEPGRASVIVYNWDRSPAVDVDLSAIAPRGTRFTVRDVQDYFGAPLLSGTADGRPVRLPIRAVEGKGVLDSKPGIPATGPEFGVFVVQTGPAPRRTAADAP